MLVVPTEVRLSTIHGIGVFLTAPVKKGDLIWRFDSRIDRVYNEDELDSLPELTRQYIKIRAPWHKASKLYVLCGDNMKHVNHSKTPNTVAEGDAFTDLFAAHDIAIDTEITENYHFSYDNSDIIKLMNLR